jgi:hypothetical protein
VLLACERCHSSLSGQTVQDKDGYEPSSFHLLVNSNSLKVRLREGVALFPPYKPHFGEVIRRFVYFDVFFGSEVAFFRMASRSFDQVTSSGSGSTRVSAVAVMKLVSPLQRGRACICR